MSRTCTICGKKTRLYSRADFDVEQLGSFGFASRKVPEYMHYELWECPKCRYLMAENTLDTAELSSRYKQAEFDSGQEARLAARAYMQYLKKYCPGYPKGRAMDIGTGEGSYLKYLLRGGVKQVVGIEPSKAPVEAADKKIRKYIVNDVFRASDFEKGSFDMISCFQTVEHIPDPAKLLQGTRVLLKNGGILYLVCHDYRSLVNRMLGKKSPIYDIEHLQLFSQKSIRRLAEKEGFGEIQIFTLKNRYPVKYWLRLFPLPGGIKRWILKRAEKSWWGQIQVEINVGNIGMIAVKKG